MAVIGLWWWHSSRAKPGRRVQEPGPGSGVVPGVSPVPPQQSPGRAAAQEPDRPRGQGSAVPVLRSALSQPLQSSGTAPGAPRDRDHPGAWPDKPPWGDALGTHPVGAGRQNTTHQPGRDGATGTASTQGAKSFSSGVTQPVAALVGWGEAAHPPCASAGTQTQQCPWLSPWEGPGNVTVVLSGNLRCPARNRDVPEEPGSC